MPGSGCLWPSKVGCSSTTRSLASFEASTEQSSEVLTLQWSHTWSATPAMDCRNSEVFRGCPLLIWSEADTEYVHLLRPYARVRVLMAYGSAPLHLGHTYIITHCGFTHVGYRAICTPWQWSQHSTSRQNNWLSMHCRGQVFFRSKVGYQGTASSRLFIQSSTRSAIHSVQQRFGCPSWSAQKHGLI